MALAVPGLSLPWRLWSWLTKALITYGHAVLLLAVGVLAVALRVQNLADIPRYTDEINEITYRGAARVDVAMGEADPLMGERVVAFVESAPGFDLDACHAWFVARGIARFKTPERVVVVDTIPLLPTGKPDRSALRARVASSD